MDKSEKEAMMKVIITLATMAYDAHARAMWLSLELLPGGKLLDFERRFAESRHDEENTKAREEFIRISLRPLFGDSVDSIDIPETKGFDA